MSTSPTILSRLDDDPLLGGLVTGAWWVWWRGLTPSEVQAHHPLLARVARAEQLDPESYEQWRDVLAGCVVAVAEPHGDPVRVRLTRLPAFVNLEASPAWVPFSVIEGMDAALTVAIVDNLVKRAAIPEALKVVEAPSPPNGAGRLETSAGIIAVEPLAYRTSPPELQTRGLAVAVADYLRPGREVDPARPLDLDLLSVDIAAARLWRWTGSEWVAFTIAARPHTEGQVWAGRLLYGEVVDIWLASMAAVLEAADFVRGYLVDSASVRRLSAAGEAPWAHDPDWPALSPCAKVWASAAWAYAWRREVPSLAAG